MKAGSYVKIHTGDGVNTFPDVSVICGEHRYYLGKKDVVLNPLLIAEVLSPSTEGYEKGLDNAVTLLSVDVTLALTDVYALIDFEARP